MISKEIDITAFDSVGKCEQGQPLEIKDENGEETGVILMVLGKHADVVTKWFSRVVNASMREQQQAQKRGKLVDPKSLDEIRAQNIDGAAVRITGWRGPKQAFDVDLLKSALGRNPHWIDQVIEFSDDMGNFTKGSSAS